MKNGASGHYLFKLNFKFAAGFTKRLFPSHKRETRVAHRDFTTCQHQSSLVDDLSKLNES